MVKCQNTAGAGPFGGCVPFQIANGATGGNSTAPATTGKAARLAKERRRAAIIASADADDEEDEDDQ